jgi:phage terminase large subunit-like protein
VDLNKLSNDELKRLAESLHVLDERKKYSKQEFLFPKDGLLPRSKFPKQLAFFKAGAFYRERALIAGNRTGKTFTADTEISYHANGRYPDWWEGKRFDHPVKIWVVGKTHDTTRDILQNYLLGSRYDLGTGMIPKIDIERVTSKPGIPDAIQDAYIRHHTNGKFDGLSTISFKSYVQGVEAFMGTSIDVVHLDEEPDQPSIYTECLTRTMTTNGLIICTFTPLEGLSEVVLSFLPNGRFPLGGMGTTEQSND